MKQLAFILSTLLTTSQAFGQIDIYVRNHDFDRVLIPGTFSGPDMNGDGVGDNYDGPFNIALLEADLDPTDEFDWLRIENTGFVNNVGVIVPIVSPAPFGWDLVRPDGPVNYSPSNSAVILDTSIGDFYLPGEAGTQVGGIFLTNSPDQLRVGLRQRVGHRIQPGRTYELSVDVGDPMTDFVNFDSVYNLGGFPGYDIELHAGGELLATTASDTLGGPEGTMSTITLTYDSNNAPPAAVGERLEIYLLNRNNTAGVTGLHGEVNFDNVTLSHTPNEARPSPPRRGMRRRR